MQRHFSTALRAGDLKKTHRIVKIYLIFYLIAINYEGYLKASLDSPAPRAL